MYKISNGGKVMAHLHIAIHKEENDGKEPFYQATEFPREGR